MGLALQIAVNGVMIGLIYVLMALGFTLIFGIMRVVNFAHGEIYMVAAYTVYVLDVRLGFGFLPSLLAAMIVTGILGVLLERLLFRHLAGNEHNGMILALAVSICLQSLALIVFGPDELNVSRVVSGAISLGPVMVPSDRLFVGAVSLVLLTAFYFFLNRTHLGLIMRAVAQDAEIASLHGVRPGVVHAAAFGIASMLAGAAGALMAPVYAVFPYMGELPMMKAFVVVILGGLGSLPGAVAGGLLLGIVESAFATLATTTVATMASFTLVLAMLVVRPQGLFGTRP